MCETLCGVMETWHNYTHTHTHTTIVTIVPFLFLPVSSPLSPDHVLLGGHGRMGL